MSFIGVNIESRKMNKMSSHDGSNYFGDLRTVILGEVTLGLALEG